MIKSALRSLAYRSGVLPSWHATVNRNTLTVVLFHRVLPFDTDQPRRQWPPWTVTPEFFEQCLQFFRTHYNLVGLDTILAALDSRGALPPRALLVTFDDGWRDTAEIGAPILRRLGIPCLLFAVGRLSEGVELWQEPLVRAWLGGDRPPELWQSVWRSVLPSEPFPPSWSFQDLQRMLAAMDRLPAQGRAGFLETLGVSPAAPNAMMDGDALKAFAKPPFAVGAHGLSHLPMTLVTNPTHELMESRQRLESLLGCPSGGITAMSWPHGAHSPGLTAAAFASGYRCLFTSDAILNSLRHGVPSSVLGRVEPSMAYCADQRGSLRQDVLASLLFRLPHRRLPSNS